jgi:hypothetical protein
MDKKQVLVEDLEFGMYVAALDRPWLGTPFVYQGFQITSANHIDELKKHCRAVYIDVRREWTNDGGTSDGASAHHALYQSVRGSAVHKEVAPVEMELDRRKGSLFRVRKKCADVI